MLKQLTLKELETFADIAYRETGIVLGSHKLTLVSNRLGRRVNALKLPSFERYLQYLLDHIKKERQFFIDCITTNETYFFRCPQHFHYLAKEILQKREQQHQITVWSAASSSGEEAYSLAILLNERLANSGKKRIVIYASDIDSQVLGQASTGIYHNYALRYVRPIHLQKYFTRLNDDSYQVTPDLRKMVKYGQHKLQYPFPKGKVDLIFCRNVMIYFSDSFKEKVYKNLMNALLPNGYLFVGESEILPDIKGLHRISASCGQKVE